MRADLVRDSREIVGPTLSSLLLFYIYHLQLNSCLQDLQQLAETLLSNGRVDCKSLTPVIDWAHGSQARRAAHYASKIWSLLENEARI